MGYNSGRTGDQTKILLNKVDNHALYKGTVALENDVPASLAANALIIAKGIGCEVTDVIDNTSLLNKQAVINISNNGKATLTALNGNVAEDNAVVHKGTSSSPSVETIYGTKTFEDKIKLNWTDPTETDIDRTSQIIANQKGLTAKNMYVGQFEYNFIDGNSLSDPQVAAIKLSAKSVGTREYRINLAHPNSSVSGVDWYSLKLPLVGSTGSPATLATTEDCGTKLYKHTLTIYTSGPTLEIISLKSTPYSSVNEIALNHNSSASFLDCYAPGVGHIECVVLANGILYLYGYEFINNIPTLGCLFESAQYLVEIQDTFTPL